MRIAFFSDCYIDLTGGIVSSMTAQKRALEAMGHTVYLFSTSFPRSKEERKKYAEQNIILVPSCKLFFLGLAPISRRPRIIEKWILKNYPEIRDFDVFHAHYESGCSIAGIRLARQLHIPIIQTMHGREDMGETNLIPYGLRSFVAFCLNLFHNFYLPHPVKVMRDDYLATTYARAKMWTLMVNHANAVDLVLSPSEHFKNKLECYGVTRPIRVMPNGVADDIYEEVCPVRELKPGEKMNIIWHSRVSAEKRMMPFLKALAMVGDGYHLDIYGGGGDAFRARRFIHHHHLDATFHGNATFETILKRLRKAHLDVLVSYNFDTFGMTLAEAEACGVPVLICDPDMQEIVPTDGSILCVNPSSEAMAESLRNLIMHPEKIAKMSHAMVKCRDEHRQSRHIDELVKIYEEMIRK